MRIERTGHIEKITPRFEEFINGRLRGVRLDDVHSPERSRIDFECWSGLLAIELKTLEGAPTERTHNFVDSLRERPDFPTFLGSFPLEAALKNMSEPEKLRRAAIERLGRTIVTHLKKAHDQFAHHEEDFPRDNRVRLLVLVNEDHPEYDPETVGWIVQREFARVADERPRYSLIDAVLYLTERHADADNGLLILPLVEISGPGLEDMPWKEDVVDRVMHLWAEWNGVTLKPEMPEGSSFEAVEHIPERMPRDESWRLQYRRRPYLRSLSDEELRDRFDEVTLVNLFWGLKNSPIKLDQQSQMKALEQFTHIQIEMHHRAIPMEKFRYEPEREIAAARRLDLPNAVIEWLRELEQRPR